MAKKKKLTVAAAAVATAAAVMLGGTFAWQSISQKALNEASDVINPGGRLHDDFYIDDNGDYNADVYVENFAEDDIFARVKLQEYMEIVINQGTPGQVVETVVGQKLLDGTPVTDVPTDNTSGYEYEYVTHYFDDTNATDDFWRWIPGDAASEEVWYMPTFNVNKDSLVADRNGMYVDRIGGISNRSPDQYDEWNIWGAGNTVTDTAIYDIDPNWNDEVGYDFENLAQYEADGHIKTIQETHEAQPVGYSNGLISMGEWLDLYYNGEATEDYWVYDSDGWVYWSSPITEKSATGRLLDAIELKQVMDDTWYYAINVIGQFVTADDVGKTDGSGFYADEAEAPTAEAEELLAAIGVDMSGEAGGGDDEEEEPLYSTIDLYHDGNSDTLTGGEFLMFDATVYDADGNDIAYTDEVTFSVQEVLASDAAAFGLFDTTSMDGNVLLVAEDIVPRGVAKIIVSASYEADGTVYEGSYELLAQAGESPLHIGLTVDGKEVSTLPGTNVYQLFMAMPADKTFSFAAEVDDVPAAVEWNLLEDHYYTVETEGDYDYAVATGDWDEQWEIVEAGTRIAQLDTTNGEFKVLIRDDFPRTLQFEIEAVDEESGYRNSSVLFLGRVVANFLMTNADAVSGGDAAHTAYYTAGTDSVINLAFDLTLNDAEASIDVSKLQNWALYEGEYAGDGSEIDASLYSIATNAESGTATLTIPASSGITEEKLALYVEYNHGATGPREPDGVSDCSLKIVESSVSTDSSEVTRLEIMDDEGNDSTTYTPGTYRKIRLDAEPRTADDEYVGRGTITWAIQNNPANVKLVQNGFSAEVWLLKADADEIVVTALYSKPGESSIHRSADYTITSDAAGGGGSVESDIPAFTEDDSIELVFGNYDELASKVETEEESGLICMAGVINAESYENVQFLVCNKNGKALDASLLNGATKDNMVEAYITVPEGTEVGDEFTGVILYTGADGVTYGKSATCEWNGAFVRVSIDYGSTSSSAVSGEQGVSVVADTDAATEVTVGCTSDRVTVSYWGVEETSGGNMVSINDSTITIAPGTEKPEFDLIAYDENGEELFRIGFVVKRGAKILLTVDGVQTTYSKGDTVQVPRSGEIIVSSDSADVATYYIVPAGGTLTQEGDVWKLTPTAGAQNSNLWARDAEGDDLCYIYITCP